LPFLHISLTVSMFFHQFIFVTANKIWRNLSLIFFSNFAHLLSILIAKYEFPKSFFKKVIPVFSLKIVIFKHFKILKNNLKSLLLFILETYFTELLSDFSTIAFSSLNKESIKWELPSTKLICGYLMNIDLFITLLAKRKATVGLLLLWRLIYLLLLLRWCKLLWGWRGVLLLLLRQLFSLLAFWFLLLSYDLFWNWSMYFLLLFLMSWCWFGLVIAINSMFLYFFSGISIHFLTVHPRSIHFLFEFIIINIRFMLVLIIHEKR